VEDYILQILCDVIGI